MPRSLLLGFIPLPPAPSQPSLCPSTRWRMRPNPALVLGRVLSQQRTSSWERGTQIPAGQGARDRTGRSGRGARDTPSQQQVLALTPGCVGLLPVLRLPHSTWSCRRRDFGTGATSPPRDLVLGMAVWAGLEEQGEPWASPHAAPRFGAKPLLLGFAWHGDRSSPPICRCEARRLPVPSPRRVTPPQPVRPGALVPPLARRSQRPAFLLLPWAMKQSGTLGKGLTERVTHSQRDILFG